MKKNRIIILAASVFAFASCTYQNNNVIEQDDVNENNKWVYGVSKDSAAAQLKLTYTPNPDNETRATAIKEKLYGKPAPVGAVAAVDSASATK